MHANPLPILYSFRRCPYAMRARLAVYASGQTCELREIVLRDKPAAMLQASPKGTVPVLVLPDGKVIAESLDIMRWALANADPEGWLTPQTGTLDELMHWISRNDTEFKPLLDRYKYPDRYQLSSGEVSRDAAVPWLNELNARLEQTSWLFGERPALADMATLPFIRQFAHVDREWFAQQPWKGVHRWLDAFLGSELFQACMNKYPVWRPEGASAPLIFSRDLSVD